MLTAFKRQESGDRSAEQMQITVMRAELAAQIERHTAGIDGIHATAVPQLGLARLTEPPPMGHALHQPALCVLAQGSKRLILNDEVYVYDSSTYLVVSQNLPVSGHVIAASRDVPYLGLKVEFDPREIASLVLELGATIDAPRRAERAMFTGEMSTALLDPLLRLVNLLDTPADIATLAPLCKREILYRVLRSPEGWRLAQMAVTDSHSQRITQVINWLHTNFDRPLQVEALARDAAMSVSSLHAHFKSVTAMSPLQFQKQLRLQEARRIMLAERVDAGLAGHRVGYESASQFNREYARFFGAPPARDIKRLREEHIGPTSAAEGSARAA
ncbi:AraC family transcriptional regulator [Pelomonas sp. KK5]|uniref:AraC family transcriptional regulator n=1 Tax=Pelomonas sp. KK5 TaxID=1855730 RepID=UPI001E587624|nr:AraC family transcriptional regulator [Pelomonas sp. KK5]